MKYCVKTLAAASMVLGLTTMVSAQAPAPPAPAPAQAKPAPAGPLPVTQTTMPTWEFSAGYQYLFRASSETAVESDQFPYGLMIDGARNWGAFGLVGELGWSYRTEGHSPDQTSFNMFHGAIGGRWSLRASQKFWPYFQVLVGGVAHNFDGERGGVDFGEVTTHMIVQPGGGFTWVVGDGWGIVVAADYRRLFLGDSETLDPFIAGLDQGVNQVRVFGGFRMILD